MPTPAEGIFERPAELLQSLIRFDTTNPPGRERECITYIGDLLKAAGLETTLLAKEFERPNLLARLRGRGEAPPLMLYGHVDVVTAARQEWAHPPFAGAIEGDYIWGRGALDMKSGVAMMVAALLRAKAEGLAAAGDILFAALSDEEDEGKLGARFLVENHSEQFEGVRYALGEFGGVTMHMMGKRFYPIQVAEKQLCWMRTTLRGPGGHGSRPMRGGTMAKLSSFLRKLETRRTPVHITPIPRLMIETLAKEIRFPAGFLLRLLLRPTLTDPILGMLGSMARNLEPLFRNTVNATIVGGGEKINVIPSEVDVQLDGRLLPGFAPEDLSRELQTLLGERQRFEVLSHDPVTGEPDMGLFDMLAGILREADPEAIPVPMLLPAVTDGRLFSRLNIQTYGFTPMKLPRGFSFFDTIHAADERIPVAAVEFGAEAIYRAIERYRI